MKELWLTTADVARVLDRSVERVRQLEREGRLQASRTLRGKRIFSWNEVQRFARSRRGQHGDAITSRDRRRP